MLASLLSTFCVNYKPRPSFLPAADAFDVLILRTSTTGRFPFFQTTKLQYSRRAEHRQVHIPSVCFCSPFSSAPSLFQPSTFFIPLKHRTLLISFQVSDYSLSLRGSPFQLHWFALNSFLFFTISFQASLRNFLIVTKSPISYDVSYQV